MREALEALTEELRRLKADGVRGMPVSEATLAHLRSVVEKARRADPGAAASPPPPAREAAVLPRPDLPVPAAPAALARTAPALPAGIAPVPPTPPVVELPAGDKRAKWNALKKQVLDDPVCRAHVRPGKQVVLGVGDLDAKIFFCGEAPGADEEVQGEPFVGAAGQLLNKMIQAMGLKREQVYIGNIMNWRPELPVAGGGEQYGNRPPTPEEMAYCLPYLRAQIEIVQPELIVALGATAAGGLLGQGTFKTLGEIRSRWHQFAGKPVMVTYHPSYILRNQSNRSKRAIWEDLMQVMERAGLAISEKQRAFFL
ncbi:MAG TPA: uracil-DNA glycosylase [Opitutaceae bacterium]|nr:uracil-DNA glycosylase [Opitutaceae bacterium]